VIHAGFRAGLAGGGAQNQAFDTTGRDQRDMVSGLSAIHLWVIAF
jgi:hypothetical protein